MNGPRVGGRINPHAEEKVVNLGLGHMSSRAATQSHPPGDITICVGVASSGLPTREGAYGTRADAHTPHHRSTKTSSRGSSPR